MDRQHIKRRRINNIKRVLMIIAFDVVLAGVGLVIFAFFHHVVPRNGGSGVVLQPDQSINQDAADITLSLNTTLSEDKSTLFAVVVLSGKTQIEKAEFEMEYLPNVLEYLECSPENGVTFTREEGKLLLAANSPGEKICSVSFKIVEKISESPIKLIVAENEVIGKNGIPVHVNIVNGSGDDAAQTQSGDFSEKFADKFTAGEIVKTENTYINQNVNVKLDRVQKTVNDKQVVYFVADIYVRSAEFLRTGLANDTYGNGYSQGIEDFSQNNNAIIAINGDYYGARSVGVVVRNGVFYRGDLYEDVLVMWKDGVMATFEAAEFNFDTVQAQHGGVWQAWSFGPELLDNKQAKTTFNSKVIPSNPRTAIGYYEPGHYCLIVVDGRQSGYSEGLRMEELSTLFYDLGCTVAYNLDGGQSSVLTWDGKIENTPYNGGRRTSDFIYIPEE